MTCQLRPFCLPAGLSRPDVARVAPMVRRRVRLSRRETIQSGGETARSVYAIRVGTLKTHFTSRNGREKVSGFHMAGEIVGLDSLAGGANRLDATALDDVSLCEIPAERLKAQAAEIAALRNRLLEIYGELLRRDRELTAMLVLMSAEERVAAFLLEQSTQLSARGYAASEFLLRMTRDDIGSYLGLTLETISRVLARLATARMIAFRHRQVAILDHDALQSMADGTALGTLARR